MESSQHSQNRSNMESIPIPTTVKPSTSNTLQIERVKEVETFLQQFDDRVYLDVESLWCYFCVSFRVRNKPDFVCTLEVNPLTGQNDYMLLVALIEHLIDQSIEIVTFNGYDYDLPLLNYVIQTRYLGAFPPETICKNLKQISDVLINSETYWLIPQYKTLRPTNFKSLDFYRYWTKLIRLSKHISLKAIGIQLGYPVVQELPIYHDTQTITPEEVETLKYYNSVHDLMILIYMDTKRFNWQGSPTTFQEMIDLRYTAIQTYGFSHEALSWDAVKLGLAVLLHDFPLQPQTASKTVVVKDILSPVIRFRSTVLQQVLDTLKRKTVTDTDEINYEIVAHGTIYDLKSGGLHNHCIPGCIRPKEDEVYLDWDVLNGIVTL